MLERLETIEKRYMEMEDLLSQPDVLSDQARVSVVAKERASLEEAVSVYREYKKVLREIEGATALFEESGNEELKAMAREEVRSLEERRREMEDRIKLALLPKDPNDQRDIIMEVRAGAGGEEASLFATELFRMYSRYAQNRGWHAEVLSSSTTGLGGLKEIVLEVRGKGAYSCLKHESGVHRVQRVPVTESSGRIHTSTSTVAVLPEPEEVEVQVNPDEIKVDVFHASGHGGQNVQKVASAVRLTHLPSGIVVVCQDERSQVQNKRKAMQVLRARLYEMEQRKQEEEITASRRSQIGAADRSEKIRTYNFPQNRVTDHRTGLTVHNLEGVLDGNLDGLLEALIAQEHAQKLEEAGLMPSPSRR